MERILVDCDDSIRLDRYLRRLFPSITQGVIEKALRQGDIKFDSSKASSSTRISNGDIILIYPGILNNLDKKNLKGQNHSSAAISLAKKLKGEYLIYSNSEFFAINKPFGLAVQGGSKIKISIDDALSYLNEKEQKNYKLVHRIDKETSGILLIADGFKGCRLLGKAFEDRKIIKTYLAKVSGCPTQREGFLSTVIGKDRSGTFEVVKEQELDGKLAETNFKVISSNGRTSLLELSPKTGRMHQLRFHCKYLGCPIIGDQKYGGAQHERMMLHAASVEIDSSIFGKKILIQAPMEM
jgi:23S rRNA pseudouridine955/2504/2580 synthase